MIQDGRLEVKEKFLAYFRELPIQKLAAGWIARDEDTICLWKNEDKDFSDQIIIAKSEWAKRQTGYVKSKEWLLERVMNDHFGERKQIDITSGGKPILGSTSKDVPSDDSHQETPETDKKD